MAVSLTQVISLSQPDRISAERCRADDRAVFDDIVGKYKSSIYNYIYRMINHSDDAEDLTQEVFVRVYQSLDSFRRQSSLHTWLFRIAGNLCIDHYRRSKKHRAVAYSLDDHRPGETAADDMPQHEIADSSYEPLRLVEQQEMMLQVESALRKLPEKLRAVVILHDMEGLPYEEIAQIVGCPLGTVKSRLFNGRLQLRERLTRYLKAQG